MENKHRLEINLPIIVLTYVDAMDLASLDELNDAMTRQVNINRRPYGMFILAAPELNVPMHALQRQGRWMKEHRQLLAEHCAGVAFVFDSPVYRLMLSTIFLVQPMPMPYAVMGTLKEAEPWIADRLRERGIQNARMPSQLANLPRT